MQKKKNVTLLDASKPNQHDPNWLIFFKGMESDDIRRGFLNNLEYSLGKDKYTLTTYDQFLSLSLTIRERLIERWILTQQTYHNENTKRVYYLSLEFLLGRLLSDNFINLNLEGAVNKSMGDLGLKIEDVVDQEPDAGLGNGGLGRLAACFLESMATMELPCMGYGIRYDFGIFKQKIVNGYQHEMPEHWLQFTNPWEIERPEYKVNVKFFGKTKSTLDKNGNLHVEWVDTEDVIAMPYDVPVPGFGNSTVNTLRLWSSRAPVEFDFGFFNSGDYIRACQDKFSSENISKVLYPNDNNHSGKELRLKQQYFFTSASLQDIIRRFKRHNENFATFPEKVAIQLNDTHPSISIAELMRILIDDYAMGWGEAWEIVTQTFAYTNHTLMPEALEKWPVSLFKSLLPRLMEIIYEINARFLRQVSYRFPGDNDKLMRMSLIEEGSDPQVRMAYLAIAGSHSVNGVAKLHTKLLESGLMKDFYDMWPEKFNNKTNGITPRRWLYKANSSLAGLITETIGDGWIKDLSKLQGLKKYSEDKSFQKAWQEIKYNNKKRLVDKINKWDGIQLSPDFMYDVQIKRMHEYKRQLLNVLHVIALYNQIKSGAVKNFVPRTVLFAGKAAPGYFMAKLVIKFINSVADVINHDPATKGLLEVHFAPNYRVSLAEYIVPAADLSEQISTAGTEASGTGNMKFALNGALTIGTMDGANIEICEEVGDDNIFIFGLKTDEVAKLRNRGYNPWDFYNKSPVLKRVMDLIGTGFFSPEEPQLFRPIYDSLLVHGDKYMLMADFDGYVACQKAVSETYLNQSLWTKMSINNVASMGQFSSDRTIAEYVRDIWHVKPVCIDLNR